jgi:hypothetical protein
LEREAYHSSPLSRTSSWDGDVNSFGLHGNLQTLSIKFRD